MTDDIKALVADLRGQSERVRAAIEVAGLAWDGDDLPSRAADTIEALEAELVKLHGLRDQWQEIVFAPDFTAAAEAAARQYHDGECIYKQERDAYAAVIERYRIRPVDDYVFRSTDDVCDWLRARADQIENGEEAHRG